MGWVSSSLSFLATLFVLIVGLVVLAAIVMFFIDRFQTADAVRRNYPVLGRFRGLFTELGEFFRQYFFAMDREELPFNRAQRNYVERASHGRDNTIAFGSTRNLAVPGTPIFVNAAFPPLDSQIAFTEPRRIGPFAREPYDAPSLFNISGMSYGALSRPAILALSHGAAKAGIWLNTGEGGLSEHHLKGGCDIVFQIGTAKYGVRTEDGALSDARLREVANHPQVRMFEIKLSQGAKPGKGGILPAAKVTKEIAQVRNIRPGEASISPNRHLDISNNSELMDRIAHIREVTGKPVGIKMTIGGTDALESLLRDVITRDADIYAPDFIAIDGGDGGTGAAPMPLMDLVGLPVRESLPMVADLLKRLGLSDRIRLIASGKLGWPGDVAWAIAAGADFVTSARGFMFALGCIQALKCNKNTCPTGITTHDRGLQKGLVPRDKSDKVAAYARQVIKEVETIAHSVGVTEPRQIMRHHLRIVQEKGQSVPMHELHPPVTNPTT
ncbi:MAG: FMN-binding glutamate synthase family protein [Pseudomonadota bacterium]